MATEKLNQRAENNRGIKGIIYGLSGIGKTSLLHTLNSETTLALDLEAGMLAVDDLAIDSIKVRDWRHARMIAALVGGANPASEPGAPYSQEYVDQVIAHLSKNGQAVDMDKYETIFIDSITVASRLCLAWAKQQPVCFTTQNKFDARKAYGLLKDEMVAWATQLQHAHTKNVWLVGLIDKKEEDDGTSSWKPQIEGSSVAPALKGIFDQVVTMCEVQTKTGDDKPIARRAFVNHTINPWGYPAKDRGGRLGMIEPAHLGKLMEKIKTGPRYNPNFDYAEFLQDEIVY